MSDIDIRQMPAFRKVYKKLHSNERKIVNDAIEEVVKNPLIGEEKKGDLAGVYVYKFKVSTHLYLLAYEWDPESRVLLMLGSHENFYRDLKNKQ